MKSARYRQRAWGLLRKLVARPRPKSGVRFAVAVGAALAIAVVGLIDYATGPDISLAVFFLLPVTIGTITLGTRAGLVLAAESSAVWVLANAYLHEPPNTVVVSLWIGMLRFVILAVVVALLAGFREALDDARTSEQRSRQFLANAAHQLRTPVAGIRTSAEALLAEGGTPAQERILANLATETGRAGRLLASLLRIARLDQGEALDARPTDITVMCRNEITRVRDQNPTLQVDFDVVGAVPKSALLDADATREALGNLLDNARRHARRAVVVRLALVDQTFKIRVRDDGPGLPSGSEERAFARFVSLDGLGGAGLGLAIARDFVESQGGDLVYYEGSFVMSLPCLATSDS